MNIGIAIDVQRGFLDSNTETRELEGRITSLLNQAPFDVLFATKFVNGKNSPYQTLRLDGHAGATGYEPASYGRGTGIPGDRKGNVHPAGNTV